MESPFLCATVCMLQLVNVDRWLNRFVNGFLRFRIGADVMFLSDVCMYTCVDFFKVLTDQPGDQETLKAYEAANAEVAPCLTQNTTSKDV